MNEKKIREPLLTPVSRIGDRFTQSADKALQRKKTEKMSNAIAMMMATYSLILVVYRPIVKPTSRMKNILLISKLLSEVIYLTSFQRQVTCV